jgi:hypothetical protein
MRSALPIRPLLIALPALVLSACVVAPVGQPAGTYPAPTPVYAEPVVVAPVAPPAPYVEVMPVAPYAGAVWVSGYWSWSNQRHVWMPGRYVSPRPGYRWDAHRWERGHGGWQLRGGGWVH